MVFCKKKKKKKKKKMRKIDYPSYYARNVLHSRIHYKHNYTIRLQISAPFCGTILQLSVIFLVLQTVNSEATPSVTYVFNRSQQYFIIFVLIFYNIKLFRPNFQLSYIWQLQTATLVQDHLILVGAKTNGRLWNSNFQIF